MRRSSGGRRASRQVEAEPLQRTGHVTDRVDGDAGVERRRLQLGVSQQHLNHANIDILFEQMRCEAVPQGVRRHALGDPGVARRRVHGAVELTATRSCAGIAGPRELPPSRIAAVPTPQSARLWEPCCSE